MTKNANENASRNGDPKGRSSVNRAGRPIGYAALLAGLTTLALAGALAWAAWQHELETVLILSGLLVWNFAIAADGIREVWRAKDERIESLERSIRVSELFGPTTVMSQPAKDGETESSQASGLAR